MRLPQFLAALLLVCTATAVAPPATETLSEKRWTPHGVGPKLPEWNCSHIYAFLFTVYIVEGRNWGKSEKELKAVPKSLGMMTGWNYRSVEKNATYPDEPDLAFLLEFNLDVYHVNEYEFAINAMLKIDNDNSKLLDGTPYARFDCPLAPAKVG